MRDLVLFSAASKTIEASNVAQYVVGLDGDKEACFDRMIVNATPPFETCFVEFGIPPGMTPQIRTFGWAIERFNKGDEPQVAYDALMQIPSPAVYEKCEHVVLGCLALRTKLAPDSKEEDGIICPVATSIMLLGSHGECLQPPFLSITQGWFDIKQDDWAIYWAHWSNFTAMLAFCFMNCKNVTVQPVDPDAKLNRERTRHGLKPFLRYHTINIEPMRKVLKTEGGIETNGLKKALHICRGHFARYSEDKPLFGHTSGLVWRPAHTRGAINQGVVISDYKVNAPKTGV